MKAFALLVYKVTGLELAGVEDVLSDDGVGQEFMPMTQEYNLRH